MCDTAVLFDRQRPGQPSYFAKNSDRDTTELQLIHVARDPLQDFAQQPYLERVERYVQYNLPALRQAMAEFDHPYSAVLSRPVWMWGAEMGVNQHGVAIGNEAVFSQEPTPDEGLLGMDILRLALHNAATAAEAYQFIIRVLESYGQGGDGGYSSSLYYHNSFLIKDAAEAFLLETAGKHWAGKRIVDRAAISNTYSLRTDGEQSDEATPAGVDFKAHYEDRAVMERHNGEPRLAFSTRYLQEQEPGLAMMQNLLRTHGAEEAAAGWGRDALCIHPQGSAAAESTASMVVQWVPEAVIVWFTGTPQPCRSLFKPLLLAAAADAPFTDTNFGSQYAEANRQLTRAVGRAPAAVQQQIMQLRDTWEEGYRQRIDVATRDTELLARTCRECFDQEADYQKQVRDLLG